jgi:hypothetical protein
MRLHFLVPVDQDEEIITIAICSCIKLLLT